MSFLKYVSVFAIILWIPTTSYLYAQTNGEGWEKINSSTITLKGNIVKGSYRQFLSVFDERIETVIVNSWGGDTYEAVQIGLVLKNLDVTVIVRGVCLSSCANYIFLAGKLRVVAEGIVGFHGNTIALVEEIGGLDKAVASAFPPSHRVQLGAVDFRKRIRKTIEFEKQFFEELGIPQSFFNLTQRTDKGADDGKAYQYLLPSYETYSKYNIRNIVGDHHQIWIDYYIKQAEADGVKDPSLLVESSF